MLSRPRWCCFAMRMLELPTAHIYCLHIIALSRLHGNMPEQELNLLRLPTCRVTQLGTRAPQDHAEQGQRDGLSSVLLHHMPD
jgi:hypothetical protein